jgi:hypothetical protein
MHYPDTTPLHPACGRSGVSGRTVPPYPSLFILLCSLLLTACDKPAWPYPIKDSGFSAKDAGYHSAISWLDERRVLFEGHEGDKPRSVEAQQAVQWGLFIWDVEANTVQKYKVPAEGLCYHDGFIKYFTRGPDGEWMLMKGEMGNEQPYPGSFYHDTDRSRYSINEYSCRLNERPKSMIGRAWVPLLEEHGYLDRGPQKGPKSEKMLFVPADGSQPLELPFDRTKGRLSDYYAFSNSYFFSGKFSNSGRFGTSPWREGSCDHVWDFTPDGKTTSQCLPYYEQLGTASKYAIKTALGIAMVSHDSDRYGPGKSGIYLYRDGEYERLIAGHTENHDISPSGCRIAFRHELTPFSNAIGWPGNPTLVMIDLCSKEGNKQ